MKLFEHPDPRLTSPVADWINRPMTREQSAKWDLSEAWDSAHMNLATLGSADAPWNGDALIFAIFGGAK